MGKSGVAAVGPSAGGRERRRWTRYKLSCPVVLKGEKGLVCHSRTVDISDGGCYLVLTKGRRGVGRDSGAGDEWRDVMTPGGSLRCELRLPRETPNTFMLEKQVKDATVRRVEPAADGRVGLAVCFREVTPLGLEL